jgi:hypothetical protein
MKLEKIIKKYKFISYMEMSEKEGSDIITQIYSLGYKQGINDACKEMNAIQNKSRKFVCQEKKRD